MSNIDVGPVGRSSDEREDIVVRRGRIASSEIVKLPIGLYGRELRIMGIEGGIGLIAETRRNCVPKEQSPDVVFDRVRFIFVKSDDDQSLVIIEIAVVE